MAHPTFLFFFFPFVFSWGILAVLIIPYFLPTIIAMLRKSASTGGIFVLNFFLGWTFIGWIISLVWAIASRTTTTTIIVNNNYPPSYNPEPTRPPQQTSPTLRRK